MILENTHPAWPEQASFRCPVCNAPITEYDETLEMRDERAVLPCPACGETLVVTRELTVNYAVTRM